jgi:glycerophosphoryl diester phosphodiesterase
VHCRHDTLTAERIRAAHEAGLGVLAYTVNDTERALALFGAGVDALVTDELREIRADFLALYSPAPR